MIKLPEKFEQRMKVLLKEEFSAYINSLQKPPVKGFRVNTEKISLNDFEKINPFGNKKIPYVENGFYLDFEKPVSELQKKIDELQNISKDIKKRGQDIKSERK